MVYASELRRKYVAAQAKVECLCEHAPDTEACHVAKEEARRAYAAWAKKAFAEFPDED